MAVDQLIKRTLALVLFGALRGIQETLVGGRRTIDRLMGISEGLGHFLATRLLAE